MKNELNKELVEKSISYHGQPFQKIWEGEHGEQSLVSLGIINPDYSVYNARQKKFAFHDRAKRLQIHSMLAKKASELFKLPNELNKSRKSTQIAVKAGAQSKGIDGEYHITVKSIFKLKKKKN